MVMRVVRLRRKRPRLEAPAQVAAVVVAAPDETAGTGEAQARSVRRTVYLILICCPLE
jgi:hypothetical protein